LKACPVVTGVIGVAFNGVEASVGIGRFGFGRFGGFYSCIQQFLPQALSKDEIRAEVEKALAASGLPREMASMKPLMATLKPALEGRADMAFVSQYLRTLLQNS